MSKVCIDSGHFKKYNRCPSIPEYFESVVMWKLHLLQKKYLEAMGIEVVTTRSDANTDLALHARGNKAKGCDLFISDHTNAVGSAMNEAVDYVAVYHLTDDTTTTADEESEKLAKMIAPVIAEVMGTKQGFKVLTRNSINDRNGDGIMNDNYYGVLHGARTVNVPALILEHSFHTNTKTVNWLLNDNNLERLAKAEAECIAKYLGVNVEASTESTLTELYRVQVGAFSKQANAEKMLDKVKNAGFDTYLVFADGLYKVQVGAYSKKENAEKMLAKVKNAGFDTYITTNGGQGVTSVVKKTAEEVAKEVIAGKWGNGVQRKKNLEKAGYNYSEIQKLVNDLV